MNWIKAILLQTKAEQQLAKIIGKDPERKTQELFEKITQYVMFNGYDKFIELLNEGIPKDND